MFKHRTSGNCTILFLFCLIILTSCTTTPTNPTPGTIVVTRSTSATPIATVVATPPTPTNTPVPPTPQHYTAHVIFKGNARPDDLLFDAQGHLLFSDFYNGTISRVNADHSVTILYRNIAGPEGLVLLPDGTMIIAEQRTNRILSLAPGVQSPSVLRTLPGTPSTAQCKDGVDGIALDPTTNTLIIPDSPSGTVYRMSLDGKTFTLLASGIVRPVGAAVDAHGTVYIADECGGAIWRISPNGQKTRIGGFGMPDDIAIDPQGNLLVIDLLPSIHALIRLNLATGKRQTLASAGFIEPQGLVIDNQGNIYVSDDYADTIVEYTPA